jgi:hypothetical protein
MPKAAARILIRVGKRKFVSNRIFLEESECVADANVVVRLGEKAWPVKIGSHHDIEIRARTLFRAYARRWGIGLSKRAPGRRDDECDDCAKKNPGDSRDQPRDTFHLALS